MKFAETEATKYPAAQPPQVVVPDVVTCAGDHVAEVHIVHEKRVEDVHHDT